MGELLAAVSAAELLVDETVFDGKKRRSSRSGRLNRRLNGRLDRKERIGCGAGARVSPPSLCRRRHESTFEDIAGGNEISSTRTVVHNGGQPG